MAMHHLTARVHRIRILSKYKSTLKRHILKEENIIKSMMYEIRGETKIDIHIDRTTIED
jgi:hypothetical protein